MLWQGYRFMELMDFSLNKGSFIDGLKESKPSNRAFLTPSIIGTLGAYFKTTLISQIKGFFQDQSKLLNGIKSIRAHSNPLEPKFNNLKIYITGTREEFTKWVQFFNGKLYFIGKPCIGFALRAQTFFYAVWFFSLV